MAAPGSTLGQQDYFERVGTGAYFGDPIFGEDDPFGSGRSAEDMFGEITGMNTRGRALERALAMSEFSPFGIQSGIGGVSFQDGQATTSLDPRLQGMSNQLFGLGQGFLGQLGSFDPMQATEQQFGLMESILNPGRERTRSSLQDQLLATGRLGSTGGGRTQEGLETSIEQSRRQGLYDAFGQAQQTQQHLAGLGGGLLQQGLGIEQMPLGLIGMGGQLGGLKSQADIARARMIMGEGEAKAGQIGGMFDEGMNVAASFFGGGL